MHQQESFSSLVLHTLQVFQYLRLCVDDLFSNQSCFDLTDFCPDPVVPLGLYDPASPYTVPVIMISYADGLRLRTTLTSSIYNQSVRVLIPGSGAVVASDRAILRDVYSAFLTANGNQPLPFNGHGTGFDVSGGLQRWDLLLSDVSYDPCLARAYGIYCIDGRIVWMVCNSCGAQGPLPAALGGLTALMEMDFSIGNALTSELPCAIGNLRVFLTYQIACMSFLFQVFDRDS